MVHFLRKRKSFAVHYAVISDAIHRGGIAGTGSIPQMGIEQATSSALSQAQPQIQGQQYRLCPLQFVSPRYAATPAPPLSVLLHLLVVPRHGYSMKTMAYLAIDYL